MTSRRATCASAVIFGSSILLGGCAGGVPLLHPARTLERGDVRGAGGVSANVVAGGLSNDLQIARNISAADPNAPGPAGSNPAYAKGALVAAAEAPGLSPFVAARVGIGNRFEGGLTYSGRSLRADVRRSFDSGHRSLSIGVGGTATLYGRQNGSELAQVDLGEIHGYGADLPILYGWQSAGGIYQVWGGARAGFEHDDISTVSSESKDITIGTPPIGLSATRYYAGAVAGFAAGLKHLHVALEIQAAYEAVNGSYNSTSAHVSGVALTPGTALWWTF